MYNPWKFLNSKIVYKNPWITVREDKVIQPNGQEGIYGVVEARIATAVVAVTPDNEIYLVGQYRYPTDQYSWEVIEGGAEIGEDPLVAAQRELKEEAGLVANKWSVIVAETHLSNCFTNEKGIIYLAQDLVETMKEPDPTEVLVIKKVPFQKCLAMVDSGEIKDAFSIIALLSYSRIAIRR